MATRVLFVDDDPNVTAGIRRNLRAQPYTIACASSATDALEWLADNPVDVVVSDERMPEMSGAEFLTAVREQYPSSVRIMLSGQADLEAVVKAVNEGEIFRFLFKPCVADDLMTTIDQAAKFKELQDRAQWLLREYRRSNQPGTAESAAAKSGFDFDEDGAVCLQDVPMTLDEIVAEMRMAMDEAIS